MDAFLFSPIILNKNKLNLLNDCCIWNYSIGGCRVALACRELRSAIDDKDKER